MDADSDYECDNESDVEIEIEEILSLDADQQSSPSPSPSHVDSPPATPAQPTWSEDQSDVFITGFDLTPGPQHSLPPSARPLDYFFLMFPLAFINTLVEETNCYAEQCMESSSNSAWYETSLDELRAFLAIQIIFGIRGLPRLWCYWSEDRRYRDPYVSSIMTIKRFKNLSRYFHCRDTSSQPQRDDLDFDPLFKIRNIVDVTKKTFRDNFTPNRELSVDETMVGFKGRLAFKMYMPAKPTKWGVKFWTICDARAGYCIGFDLYTSRAGRRDSSQPLGLEVIDFLCAPHYGQGHHMYFDRFFNSVAVANHLLENNTYSCGTVMPNRKGLPQAMKAKLCKGDLRQFQQGNLVATSYHDKRPVHLLYLQTRSWVGLRIDVHSQSWIITNSWVGWTSLTSSSATTLWAGLVKSGGVMLCGTWSVHLSTMLTSCGRRALKIIMFQSTMTT